MQLLSDSLKAQQIIKCGWNVIRYVHIDYSNSWTVKGAGNLMLPRMWIDIEGRPNPVVKRASMQAILSLAALNPGISEVKFIK